LGAASTPYTFPFAIITTSSDDAAFMKTVWAGMPYIEYNGKDNVKLLTDPTKLQVERHGNNMFVNLKESVEIERPNGAKFTIPPFSMELNGYGGSFHASGEYVFTMEGYDLSDYTWNWYYEGFKITGAFTSSAWNYVNYPISESYLTMQGTGVYYPPT
jgi:hypothetical protein